MPEERRILRVLDVDPELGEGLSPEDFREAHQRAVAELRTLEPGQWNPQAVDYNGNGAPNGHLGLLVVDGLLMRDVGLDNSICAELLGQGDLLRPWDEDRRYSTSPFQVSWRVLRTTRLAVLDRRFAAIACHWPELLEVTVSRSMRRAHGLAFHLALTNLKRVDVRLHVLLWHLSDRWGRVGVDGVSLQLPLTHEMLSHLVAAKRPSVTTALGHLTAQGVISRRGDGTWLLHGEPPSQLERVPTKTSERPPTD
jgi:CRP-like cAMP-binding protein